MTPSAVRTHQSDFELATSILQRDRKATARLVELHADGVHQYVWRRLNPKVDLVDDIVQEVFVAAWQGLRNYSGEASLRSWLLGIARNKVGDHYRRTLSAHLESLDQENDPSWTDSTDLDVDLDQSRQAEQVASLLSQLTYEYSVALRWRYWDDKSAHDMAAETGKTEKAVERLLARAREQFRGAWIRQRGGR